MRFWPFGKDLERRSSTSADYTERLTSSQLTDAERALVSAGTAAREILSSHYSRALSSVMIKPDGPVAMALGPYMGMVGRALMECGEAIFVIEFDDNGLRLLPAVDVHVYGSALHWTYDLTVSGPRTIETRNNLDAGRVLHFMYAQRPDEPWRGIGPIEGMGSTGSLLANLEMKLAQEAGGPVGQVVPVPTGIDTTKLQTDLSNLKGKLGLAPTTAGGMGQGPMGAPRKDYAVERLGADPPEALVELRRDVYRSVLAAGGLNPALASGDAPASSLREFSREFKERVVAPLAGRMELEIAAKLDDVTLDLSQMHETDVAHLAGAVDKLVSAGVPLADARAIAGL